MIALDSVTSTGQLSGSSVSFSHTTAGYNRILLVGLWADLTDIITGVTYNGVAMSQIGKIKTPGDRWVYLYYLINPTLGANTVQATFSGSVIARFITVSYKNAKQSGQPDQSTTLDVTAGTSIAPSVTTVADNCWTVFVTKNTAGSDPAAGTATTRRGNTGNLGFFDSNADITPAGLTSLESTGSNGNWGAVMASIAKSPLEVPVVDSSAASSILTASATGNGNVLHDGTDTITERGFVWSTSINPTTSDGKVTVAGTTGSYSGSMTGLSPSTLYHFRAYAINSTGTSYGTDLTFTTLALTAPTLTTGLVMNIKNTSITANGETTADGGATITERGFVVSTSANPTTSDTKYTVTGTIGTFTRVVGSLTHGTTYHMRAYAINSVGTSYGADVSFKAAFFNSDKFGINIGQEFQSGLNNFDGYTTATVVSEELEELIRGDIQDLKALGFTRFRFAAPGYDWAERLTFMKTILDIIASEGNLHLEWGVMPTSTPAHYATWMDVVYGYAQEFQTIINNYASIGVTGTWVIGNELESNSAVNITSITRASNVVTVVCPFRHALEAGWKIKIASSSVISTAVYTIASIVDEYRFTITSVGSDGSQNAGTISYNDVNAEVTLRNQIRKVATNMRALTNPAITMDLSYSCVQNSFAASHYRPYYWGLEGKGDLTYLDLNIYGVGSSTPETNWAAFKTQVDEFYADFPTGRITEWNTHFNDTIHPVMNDNLAARNEMLQRKREYMEHLGLGHYFFAYRMPGILAERTPAYNNRSGGTRPSLYLLTGNRSPVVEIPQDA